MMTSFRQNLKNADPFFREFEPFSNKICIQGATYGGNVLPRNMLKFKQILPGIVENNSR